MRFLLIIVVIVAAIYLLRRALMRMNRDAAPPPPAPGELVSCARCGLHLPRSEAREIDGRLFCSEEHARLGAGSKG